MKKILVVEDEKELASLIKLRLEGAGYGVEVVGDGQAALESVRKSAPDLIVLDLVIPRIDGYRVCELIKADEHYKHIPVIMLSVRSQVMEKKAGFAVGADEYLTKPYDPQLLLSKIKNLLKNQR